MVENTPLFQIFTLLVVAIIVYPKALVPIGNLVKLLFAGAGKLLSGIFSLLIKLLTETLKLLGFLMSKLFELLVSFFRWLINLF